MLSPSLPWPMLSPSVPWHTVTRCSVADQAWTTMRTCIVALRPSSVSPCNYRLTCRRCHRHGMTVIPSLSLTSEYHACLLSIRRVSWSNPAKSTASSPPWKHPELKSLTCCLEPATFAALRRAHILRRGSSGSFVVARAAGTQITARISVSESTGFTRTKQTAMQRLHPTRCHRP